MNTVPSITNDIVSFDNAIKTIRYFINKGGPDENEYDVLNKIWALFPSSLSETEKITLTEILGRGFIDNTILGFAYCKPHGYAGDFEIIDALYSMKASTNRMFSKWDYYLHTQEAPIAVRNRKEYFINLVKAKLENINRPIKILNIASGPCRDVKELLELVPADMLNIDCVEMDKNAIVFASNLLGDFANQINFFHENIFNFNTNEKYDLIWSAGLFDYFDDVLFVKLLRKISKFTLTKSEIVIGNFSCFNPSRPLMEIVADWFLFHRSAEELIQLAIKAKFDISNLIVRNEPKGINLFLHINIK